MTQMCVSENENKQISSDLQNIYLISFTPDTFTHVLSLLTRGDDGRAPCSLESTPRCQMN